jgi:hypothetical protein
MVMHPSGCWFDVHGYAPSGDTACNNRPAIVGRVPSRGVPVRCSMFNPSIFPYFTNVLRFSRKSNCPPHSRLMGGQFPHQKRHWRLQKPYILRGKIFGHFAKNRTVLFDVAKNEFFTLFSSKILKFFCKMRKPAPYEVGESNGHGRLTKKNE